MIDNGYLDQIGFFFFLSLVPLGLLLLLGGYIYVRYTLNRG